MVARGGVGTTAATVATVATKAMAACHTLCCIFHDTVNSVFRPQLLCCTQDFENGSGGAEGRAGTRSGGPGRGGDLDGGGKMGLASLGSTLRRQSDEMAQNVATLQRSGVGMVTVMRKVEAGLHALSTKDLFWQVREAPNPRSPLQVLVVHTHAKYAYVMFVYNVYDTLLRSRMFRGSRGPSATTTVTHRAHERRHRERGTLESCDCSPLSGTALGILDGRRTVGKTIRTWHFEDGPNYKQHSSNEGKSLQLEGILSLFKKCSTHVSLRGPNTEHLRTLRDVEKPSCHVLRVFRGSHLRQLTPGDSAPKLC